MAQKTNTKEMQRLIDYIADNTRESVPSANEIANALGIDVSTVIRWLRTLGWRYEQGRWVK